MYRFVSHTKLPLIAEAVLLWVSKEGSPRGGEREGIQVAVCFSYFCHKVKEKALISISSLAFLLLGFTRRNRSRRRSGTANKVGDCAKYNMENGGWPRRQGMRKTCKTRGGKIGRCDTLGVVMVEWRSARDEIGPRLMHYRVEGEI